MRLLTPIRNTGFVPIIWLTHAKALDTAPRLSGRRGILCGLSCQVFKQLPSGTDPLHYCVRWVPHRSKLRRKRGQDTPLHVIQEDLYRSGALGGAPDAE